MVGSTPDLVPPRRILMTTVDASTHQLFNEILSAWRRAGRSIAPGDLDRALRLAQELQKGKDRPQELGDG